MSTVATPSGPSSLHECTAPTKVYISAKNFKIEKPGKFEVWTAVPYLM